MKYLRFSGALNNLSTNDNLYSGLDTKWAATGGATKAVRLRLSPTGMTMRISAAVRLSNLFSNNSVGSILKIPQLVINAALILLPCVFNQSNPHHFQTHVHWQTFATGSRVVRAFWQLLWPPHSANRTGTIGRFTSLVSFLNGHVSMTKKWFSTRIIALWLTVLL